MMTDIKIAILEKDGVELGVATEYDAQQLFYDFDLPKDIVIDAEIYIIKLTKHHVIMCKMTVNGEIQIDGTLGVI